MFSQFSAKQRQQVSLLARQTIRQTVRQFAGQAEHIPLEEQIREQ